MKRSAITLFALLATCALASSAFAANAVRISQVYGGGGSTSPTSGATYVVDYVELHNTSNAPVSLNGWSLQYGSSGGTSFGSTATNVALLPDEIIPACGYYLVQVGTVGTTGVALPVTPDHIDANGPNMAAAAGKIALINNTTINNPCTGNTSGAIYVDVVGYGTANCFETAPTGALSTSTTAVRNGAGATDTDNNSTDFSVAASAGVTIHNSASPPNPNCQVVPTISETWGRLKLMYR